MASLNDNHNKSALLKSSQQNHHPVRHFISGACGGISLVICSHPFDLIKVRLQTSYYGSPSPSPIKAAWITFQKQGLFKGLYKGAFTVMLGSIPTLGLNFWSFEMGKKLVASQYFTMKKDDYRRQAESNDKNYHNGQEQHFIPSELSLYQIGLAGSFAGFVTSSILGPAERIKILIQTSNTSSSSLSEIIKSQYKSGGMRSIVRGTGWTLTRDIPGSFVYFATYEGVKAWFTKQDLEGHPISILLSGGLAGLISWVFIFPIDTFKSKYQSSSTSLNSRQIYLQMKQNGRIFHSLYSGLTPTLVRAFPASAGFFTGVELSRFAMDRLLD